MCVRMRVCLRVVRALLIDTRAAGEAHDGHPGAAPLPPSPPPPGGFRLWLAQEYPAAGREVRHPHDASLMTYRGHTVQVGAQARTAA